MPKIVYNLEDGIIENLNIVEECLNRLRWHGRLEVELLSTKLNSPEWKQNGSVTALTDEEIDIHNNISQLKQWIGGSLESAVSLSKLGYIVKFSVPTVATICKGTFQVHIDLTSNVVKGNFKNDG